HAMRFPAQALELSARDRIATVQVAGCCGELAHYGCGQPRCEQPFFLHSGERPADHGGHVGQRRVTQHTAGHEQNRQNAKSEPQALSNAVEAQGEPARHYRPPLWSTSDPWLTLVIATVF